MQEGNVHPLHKGRLMRVERFFVCLGAIALLTVHSPKLAGQGKPEAAGPPSSASTTQSARTSLPEQRAEWFHGQRAFPRTSIPQGVRERAVQHARHMLATPATRAAAGAAKSEALAISGPAWSPIGPQPIVTRLYAGNSASGRVTALVVDPANPSIVYMGAAQGGVWKTTQGANPNGVWTPLTDTLPSLAMGALAVDPATCSATGCNTIYAGTGEEDFSGDSYFGAGIFKSTDGGQTWSKLPGTITNVLGISSFTGPFDSGVGGARFSALAIDPNNSQVLLAAVQIFLNVNGGVSSGIYRSADGGNTWTNVQGGGAGIDIAADPAHAGTFYATLGSPGGSSSNGVYKSTNDGMTWSAISGTGASSVPSGSGAGRIALAFAPSSSGAGTLYAGVQDPTPGPNLNGLLGLFKSTDAGVTWTNLTNAPKYCSPQCWYDNVIRTQPNDPSGNTVYVGGSADSGGSSATLYRSTDGGTTWTNVSADALGAPLIHTDLHALAFAADSSVLYVGSDGGVWATSDLPTTGTSIPNWTNMNETLQITQFYPSMSIHPSNPQFGLGGTQDNNTILYQNGTWTMDVCGDGGWTIIDPVIPSTAYTACTRSILLKSVEDASTGSFSLANSGIDPTDPVDFIAPFIMDPLTDQQLYFGTNRLWQTTDAANSWNPISGVLTQATNTALTTIAVAPATSGQEILYVGTFDALLWVSAPFSSGQPAFTQHTSGLPGRTVTRIVVDPSDTSGQTAYATYSGFSGMYPGIAGGDILGHVFKTTNAGGSWLDVSCHVSDCSAPSATDLPNTPVNEVVVDPDDPAHNTLYAATDVGVFQTSNGGATWSPLGTGLPNVAVLSLRLHDPSRTLRAATHGRGAWDLLLPALAGTAAFRISSLSPPSTTTQPNSLAVTIDGAGFTSQSQVQWNGATNGIITNVTGPPTSLTATIPGALLGSAGTASITVIDPGQPSPTNALVFTVTGSGPTLSGIQPPSAQGGPSASDVNMTLTGSQFISNSQVEFDGHLAGVTTTFQSATSLTAIISHTLLAFGGVHSITVVNPPPGGGPSLPQLFTVSAPGPPVNDNFANATLVTALPFSNTVDNSSATTEATDPTPPCVPHSTNPRTKTVWYAYTAGGTGSVTLDTVGSSYDTTLSVWTASGGTGQSLQFTNVFCNDDIEPGIVTQSRLTFAASAGTTYFIMIAPFGPPENQPGGKTVFNVTTTVAPSALSASPALASVSAGSSASFTIANTPQPGVSATFTLTCSGLPTGAACMQASVAPGSTATLAISTTSRAMLLPSSRTRPAPIALPWTMIPAVLAGLVLLALFPARGRGRILISVSLAVLAIAIVLSAAGCSNTPGGGGGGGGGNGTPAGVYPILVTGASGSTTQSTTVILQVN